MYLLTDKFQVERKLKVNFKGPGIGEAAEVKGANMNWSTVKVTFSTTQPDGMLYLNYGPILKGAGPGGGNVDPYVVIYLRQGYLYTYVNSDTFVDEKLSDLPMSDGNKHTVELSVDTSNSKVVTKVDMETPLTHLFRSGNEPLGTQVLIGHINNKVRSLDGSEAYFFEPFKGCFYLFELYGEKGKLLLSLESLIYGGQVKKTFYNVQKPT
jgi:hypothetical protein